MDDIEKLCFIGTVLRSNAEIDKEKTSLLPDGNIITVGAKRLRCAQVLFQPKFTGKGASGIHGISVQMNCDLDIRKFLDATVVWSGFPNFLSTSRMN